MANEKSKSNDSKNDVLGQPKVITATRVSPTSDLPEFAHFTEGEWADREKEGWKRVNTPVTEIPNTDASSNKTKK